MVSSPAGEPPVALATFNAHMQNRRVHCAPAGISKLRAMAARQSYGANCKADYLVKDGACTSGLFI
jgi:hypothetical protein